MASELLTEFTYDHLEPLAVGAGILGTGGGGSPFHNQVYLGMRLRSGDTIPVTQVRDLPDSALVASTGGVGAPTVGVERLKQGEELYRALLALERYSNQSATHMISAEIGGGNAISPLIVAHQAGIGIVDGDGMGRAFPELQMDTYMIYGIPPTPVGVSDVRGHTAVFDNLESANDLERYVRTLTVQMGGGAGMTGPLMGGADIRRVAISGTLSFAVALGAAVIDARAHHENPVDAIIHQSGGQMLLEGKITDVERKFVAGFARGSLTIEGMNGYDGQSYTIEFQNENLIVVDNSGQTICSVPDLICIVETETGESVATESLRYGLRVSVIGIPAPHLIATPEALEVVGPAAFGYHDIEYQPLPGTYGGALAELLTR